MNAQVAQIVPHPLDFLLLAGFDSVTFAIRAQPHEVIKANRIKWTFKGFVWQWGLLFAKCP